MLLAFSTKPGARLDTDIGGFLMGAGLSGREPGYRLLQEQQGPSRCRAYLSLLPHPLHKELLSLLTSGSQPVSALDPSPNSAPGPKVPSRPHSVSQFHLIQKALGCLQEAYSLACCQAHPVIKWFSQDLNLSLSEP